jgi:hypothetical protein
VLLGLLACLQYGGDHARKALFDFGPAERIDHFPAAVKAVASGVFNTDIAAAFVSNPRGLVRPWQTRVDAHRAAFGHRRRGELPRCGTGQFGHRAGRRSVGWQRADLLVSSLSARIRNANDAETFGFPRTFFAPAMKLPLAFRQQMLLISRASFEKRP